VIVIQQSSNGGTLTFRIGRVQYTNTDAKVDLILLQVWKK